jgi:multiple sugar transport system permease protein
MDDLKPAVRKLSLFDREAPLGRLLVLPAVFYLTIFIAYPFLMSIYMSFTNAQAGDQNWTFVGADNYSKIESYEVLADNLVVAEVPTEKEASQIVAAKADAKVTTAPVPDGKKVRGSIEVAGRSIPFVELENDSDVSFIGDTILSDFEWTVEPSGGKFRVVAHTKDTPLSFGPFTKRDDVDALLKHDLLIPVDTRVKTNGTGVLQDPNFLRALGNTFKYTLGTELLKLLIGVPCALLLNRKFGGRRILRGLLVIPWVIPIALSAQGWLWILDSTYSVINWCLVHWGILSPGNIINFRGDKNWAMLSLIVVNVWRGFPFTAIVILAGLTAIPDEILERARLDGANAIQRFFYIIAPMVRPILMVSLLFSVIFSFTDFNTIWIITHGGPYDQTQMLSTYAYQVGVNAGYLGKGAAISLFMFPIMAIMVYFMLRFLRKET